MNGIDGHHSTFAQARKGAYHDLTTGCERDGTVERDGRLLIFRAHPGGAQGGGPPSMGFASGRNIDFAFPGLQDRNRQACGAAKTKEANSLTWLDPRNP